MMLKISDGLSLPLDTVTQAVAVLAKRRAGKSFLARRFAEQLHHGGQQLVIVDPKGDWWGILSSRDGKGPGLSIIIIGGERGHVPLEATGGEVVAQLVVEQRVSVLLDLSLLRKHELATFMATFMEALYRLKAAERYRTPLMLIIDEADAVAPQKPQPNEARMLGAAEDIVRRGGQRGIGCMLITQRSAVLNKNVLTQIQILIALRTISPQDLAAMNAWIDVHGTPEQRKTLMGSLPSLPVGDAWVWSPGWPTDAGIFQRIRTLPIQTFDSGATPKPGEKRVEPKRMADVDLDAVREQMAATIERAKADDPKALRKRIAELERELAVSSKGGPASPELEAENHALRERWAALSAAARELWAVTRNGGGVKVILTDEAKAALAGVEDAVLGVDGAASGESKVVPRNFFLNERQELPVIKKRAEKKTGTNGEIKDGAVRMLTALATFYPGVLTKSQVGKVAKVKSSTGTFRQYWSTIKTHGFLEELEGGLFRISPSGLKRLGASLPDVPRTKAERVAFWKPRLKDGERRMLDAVLAAGTASGASRTAVGRAAGISETTGTFRQYLSTLRTQKLVTVEGDSLRPHPWLLTEADHG